MAVLNKDNLVKYLISKHDEKFRQVISPIKLQKALYFLYAFYAGKISLLNLGNPFLEEEQPVFDVNLFDANFEAWVYGPVDPKVYSDFKKDLICLDGFDGDIFEDKINDFTKGFLIDTTERIFNTSDFTLVDLSHDDNSWKSKFDRNNPRLSRSIPNEDIINEYAIKESF